MALTPNTAASGRRNAETGKLNQIAPKAHATPINKINKPTITRSKRTSKRPKCMARGFERRAADLSIFTILFEFFSRNHPVTFDESLDLLSSLFCHKSVRPPLAT
jgi:hypothetical protein